MIKKNKEILGFNDTWLMLIGIPVVGILMALLMFGDFDGDVDIFSCLWKCTIISIFYVVIYWMIFRQIFIYFRQIFPENRDVAKRLILQSFVVVIAFFVIKTLLHEVIDHRMHLLLDIPHPDGISLVVGSLTNTFFIIAIYEGVYFYNKLQRSLVEKAELERANIQSQLEGLKNQVNPHFLFNSLNTLTHIISEDQKLGVRFVQQLAKVYRYILEIREKKLIPLSEELEFLDSYIYLLKERFEDNLQVSIEVDDEYMDHKIVPLSLQILFENAIKHNIISSSKPLEVKVFIEKGKKLIVKNKLQKKNQRMSSTKVGLKNIESRYAFFSNDPVEVLVTAKYFIVILPLIKSKIKAATY